MGRKWESTLWMSAFITILIVLCYESLDFISIFQKRKRMSEEYKLRECKRNTNYWVIYCRDCSIFVLFWVLVGAR